MDITLFTDSVRCSNCNNLDMSHGLKKNGDKWFCHNCLPNRVTVKEDALAVEIPQADINEAKLRG